MQDYKRPAVERFVMRNAAAFDWIIETAVPSVACVAVFGALLLFTFLTFGEIVSSGPAADLSTPPSPSSPIYMNGKPGPGTTLASRAGQDVYEVEL